MIRQLIEALGAIAGIVIVAAAMLAIGQALVIRIGGVGRD